MTLKNTDSTASEVLIEPPSATGYNSRIVVSEEARSWETLFQDYDPPKFTDDIVKTQGVEQGWADSEDVTEVDFAERFSHTGDMRFDENGRPLNPSGRTGLSGRGLLGKWGPNHAADPIVLSTNSSGELQVLLIQRKDTSEWALPGGMVEPGEKYNATALRELEEETGVELKDLDFQQVFAGVVGDPRDTDNAWIETVAGFIEIPEPIVPNAGDEVKGAKWVPITDNLADTLYASHGEFLKAALEYRN